MADLDYDYDLFVIGAGSGGVRASRVAAGLGARVAVCEERALGGTCVNVGCVPKKLLVMGSQFGAHFGDAAGFGWTIPEAPRFDWATLIANKDAEITRLNGVYRRLLESSGVTIITGRGRLLDPHTVAVGKRTFRARHVLVATGGWPMAPTFEGAELTVSSNELFALPALPRRLAIIGGGYIGTEFAGVFNGLGVDVTLVHRGDRVLGGFDEDVRRTLTEALAGRGVSMRLGRNARRLVRTDDGAFALTLDDGAVVPADLVVCACGRRPLTDGIGLDEVGVTRDVWGQIEVDARFRTRAASVLAIGDAVGRAQLTPVALAEGTWVARSLFAGGPEPALLDYELIPTAVFSQPEVATVGLTELVARARHGEVLVYRSEFRPMKNTLSGRDERMMMKLIVDAATDRVLGCHVVGPDAAEIVQGFAVALTCGATKAQLDRTVGIHPTAAEELVTMRTPVPPG